MKIKDFQLELQENLKKITAVIAAVVFIIWSGGVVFKSPLKDEVQIVVDEGINVYKISEILEEKGVIKNKLFFIVYVLVTGNESKLQAGRYVFRPGATMPDIVFFLANGFAESDDIVVTIPEGSNVFDIDKKISALGVMQEGDFLRRYLDDEGRLFPDTYHIEKIKNQKSKIKINEADSIKELRRKMDENFNFKTAELFRGLEQEKREETITISSILEKEAKTKEDMRLIAGVIKKRLELGMLLQVDAVVSYGACLRNVEMSIYQNFKYQYCDVSQIGMVEEIKIDGPYNTYVRTGLPPAPISNPGLEAIKAALNPTPSDYLYYLSTRDGDQIIYSKTASEHAVNRKRYLGI